MFGRPRFAGHLIGIIAGENIIKLLVQIDAF
jgi:hypothetical protein